MSATKRANPTLPAATLKKLSGQSDHWDKRGKDTGSAHSRSYSKTLWTLHFNLEPGWWIIVLSLTFRECCVGVLRVARNDRDSTELRGRATDARADGRWIVDPSLRVCSFGCFGSIRVDNCP